MVANVTKRTSSCQEETFEKIFVDFNFSFVVHFDPDNDSITFKGGLPYASDHYLSRGDG